MPRELDELIKSIQALPGIGPKAASRIAFYLLQEGGDLAHYLSHALENSFKTITVCPQCKNFSTHNSLCNICANPNRDRCKLAIVSNVSDILAIERAEVYQGLYYIFSSIDNIFDKKDLVDNDLSKLSDFISVLGTDLEVILSLPYSIDSEVLSSIIIEHIKAKHPKIEFSRIALGMPIGADFDYTDKLTINKSFRGRTRLD